MLLALVNKLQRVLGTSNPSLRMDQTILHRLAERLLVAKDLLRILGNCLDDEDLIKRRAALHHLLNELNVVHLIRRC